MTSATVCLPQELGMAEVARWRSFQRDDERLTNPFLSPEFAATLARHRPDIRLAVLEDSGRIVGFLPYQKSALGIGRGLAYGLSNGHGVVALPDLTWHAGDVLKRCGLAVWEFDYLPVHEGEILGAHIAASASASVIDLTPGWDEWLRLKRASSTTVRKVQQNQRKLNREVGEVSFEFNDQRPEVLALLIRWKSQQYRRSGRSDPFSHPWFVALVEDLTATTTAGFSGLLSVLSVDRQPIAIQQALCANGVVSCWFTAYDTMLAAYSPGQVCMLELVKAASMRGLKEVDLAKGQADYKDVLKNRERVYAEGWIERSSPVAAARRVQQWPRRRLHGVLRDHPKLRETAREALRNVGRVRATRRPASKKPATPNRDTK